MRVEVEVEAEWQFGLIQRKHRGETEFLAELQAAYFAIITELRSGNPSVWSMESELRPDAFVSYYPPLLGHFRQLSDEKVAIFSFTEMERELPGRDEP
jgi:hypothetical protein